MSMGLVQDMNTALAAGDQDVAEVLVSSADAAQAALSLGLTLDAVEKRFLTDLPQELWSSLRSSLAVALEAGRTVTVDWSPGFAYELSVSVAQGTQYDAVTFVLRTPNPRLATRSRAQAKKKAKPKPRRQPKKRR